jgi:hypothetical protein
MIQSSITHVFAKACLQDHKTQPIFEKSVEYLDCRRCTTAIADEMASKRFLHDCISSQRLQCMSLLSATIQVYRTPALPDPMTGWT